MASLSLEQVQSDAQFFDSMLEQIPVKYYFPMQHNEDAWKGKFAKHSKKQKTSTKKTAKQKKAIQQAKRDNLNPDLATTPVEVIRTQALELKEVSILGKRRKSDSALPPELKSRLQAKIQAHRDARSADSENPRKKRKAEKSETRKSKAEKKAGRAKPTNRSAEAKKPAEVVAAALNAASATAKASEQPSGQSGDDDLQFGTFKFEGDGAKPAYLERKKKSPYALLKAAEKEKKRLADLKGKAGGEQELIERKAEKALKKLQGEKVKDDPARLKKSIKRREAQKAKSQAVWADRKRTEERQQAAKQKKRNDNIQKRQDEKAARKAGKKGPTKNRPGFEGKRKKFLNK